MSDEKDDDQNKDDGQRAEASVYSYLPAALRAQMDLHQRLNPLAGIVEQFQTQHQLLNLSALDLTGYASAGTFSTLNAISEQIREQLSISTANDPYIEAAQGVLKGLGGEYRVLGGIREQIDQIHRSYVGSVTTDFRAVQEALALDQTSSITEVIDGHIKEIEQYRREWLRGFESTQTVLEDIRESFSLPLTGIVSNLSQLRTTDVFSTLPNVQALLDSTALIAKSFDEDELEALRMSLKERFQDADTEQPELLVTEGRASENWLVTLSVSDKISLLNLLLQVVMVFITAVSVYENRDVPVEDMLNDLRADNESQRELERQEVESLANLEALAARILKELSEPETAPEQFVVIRNAPLRIRPDSKSEAISRLFPNQVVEVVKESGTWRYVKFYDYQSEIPRLGWVNVTHLREFHDDESQERELEKAYAEAANEIDSTWDVTLADGLADDDWS